MTEEYICETCGKLVRVHCEPNTIILTRCPHCGAEVEVVIEEEP